MACVMVVVAGCSPWDAAREGLRQTGSGILDYFGLNDSAKEEISNPNVQQAISQAVQEFPCDGIVSEPLLAGLIYIESGGNVETQNSPAGAMGIAQFMPAVWDGTGGNQPQRYDGDGDGVQDVRNPFDAVPAMARFLCTLGDEVQGVSGDHLENTVGAYNTGGPNVRRAGGVRNLAVYNDYVRPVLAKRDQYAAQVTGAAVSGRASSIGAEIVRQARSMIGKPYVWGGGNQNGPTGGGFDCSGLVLYAVYQARKVFNSQPNPVLPHNTDAQLTVATPAQAATVMARGVSAVPGGLLPGDAIYLRKPGAADNHHVVIYTGPSGTDYGIVEAPRPGRPVRDQTLLSQYRGEFLTIVRYS